MDYVIVIVLVATRKITNMGDLKRIREMLKSINNFFEKIYMLRFVFITVTVALYVCIVIYLSIEDNLENIALLPILLIVISWIMFSARTIFIDTKFQVNDDSFIISTTFWGVIFFLIIFGGQFLYWLAYYPGGFNLDAYGQWDQVHGLQQLNNWHPVLTTVLYWLLTRVYDCFAFCIFAQLLIFSMSSSYLLLVLYNLHIKYALLVLSAVYISLNPAIGMNNVCLIKDVPHSIVIIWITIFSIKIIESEGKWINSLLHRLLLMFCLVVLQLIRHNGIFFIVTFLTCLLFFYKKQWKKICFIFGGFIAFIVLIYGPVFSTFSVEQHSNFTGEVVGVPMATMANAYISDCENIPDDIESFLLSIATEEEWKENYILGEWDSCKWEFGGTELFKENSIVEFVPKFLRTIISSPNAAYQSIRENTRVVWQVWGEVEWNTWVYIEDNDYGIVSSSNQICLSIVNILLELSLSFLGTILCWNVGGPILVFVLMIWISVVQKKYTNLLYIIPIISYDFFTAFLLCGPNHRYFYFNSVLFLPIILLMLRRT